MITNFDNSILHLLHRALQVAEGHYAGVQKDTTVTSRQYIVLSAIAAKEGQNQTEIVERSGVDRSTLGDILRRLIRNGLVQKRRSKADSRAFNVKLTPRGAASLNRVASAIATADEMTMEPLSPAARRDLLRHLNAVINATQAPAS